METNPCSHGATWSRLPRTMADWVFNTSMDGDSTASAGQPVPAFDPSHSGGKKKARFLA